jgi:peptidoglycan/xylan/chitin deacetylase (PgdA/CDA1 family)
MLKSSIILAGAASFLPFVPLSAQELKLTQEPSSVAVPAVPSASADLAALKTRYEEYYSALEAYSDAAYAAPQGSPEFMEASASGQYVRAKLDELEVLVGRTGVNRSGSNMDIGKLGTVPANIRSELEGVFGFNGASGLRSAGTRGVPIKQGYCQINYVKNATPFLVQYDGFLKKGEVIITLDDGPGPLTGEVSASMKAAGAQGVFFTLGSKLNAVGKERIKGAAAAGHYVSVHGYNHATAAGKPFTALSAGETLKQLGGVSASITAATGKKPLFFRPPYGIISPEVLKAISSELGLTPVGWTIDTLDWSTKDPEALYQNTINMIKQRGKGIVLLHDIHPQSRTALKRLLGWLAANGYKVVSPERLTQAFKGE